MRMVNQVFHFIIESYHSTDLNKAIYMILLNGFICILLHSGVLYLLIWNLDGAFSNFNMQHICGGMACLIMALTMYDIHVYISKSLDCAQLDGHLLIYRIYSIYSSSIIWTFMSASGFSWISKAIFRCKIIVSIYLRVGIYFLGSIGVVKYFVIE